MALALPLAAQRAAAPAWHTAPRANQGHIPAPPVARGGAQAQQGERLGDGRVNDLPHVNHDQWYGHDAPNDPRFHLDHPFPHGHFAHFGPSFRYNILRMVLVSRRLLL
jgi:hypothetical protein